MPGDMERSSGVSITAVLFVKAEKAGPTVHNAAGQVRERASPGLHAALIVSAVHQA